MDTRIALVSPTGFSFVPHEGLVCPRRGPRLSPTTASFVPHEKTALQMAVEGVLHTTSFVGA